MTGTGCYGRAFWIWLSFLTEVFGPRSMGPSAVDTFCKVLSGVLQQEANLAGPKAVQIHGWKMS